MRKLGCSGQKIIHLELGHYLKPEPARTTEFAPVLPTAPQLPAIAPAPAQGYAPAEPGQPWKRERFSGQDFLRQPDGTLHCPAGQTLSPTEQRHEADGSLHVVYAAKIGACRPCPLRELCQWQGKATTKPRRVSRLLHPLAVASAPLLWRDWNRRTQRRACIDLVDTSSQPSGSSAGSVKCLKTLVAYDSAAPGVFAAAHQRITAHGAASLPA